LALTPAAHSPVDGLQHHVVRCQGVQGLKRINDRPSDIKAWRCGDLRTTLTPNSPTLPRILSRCTMPKSLQEAVYVRCSRNPPTERFQPQCATPYRSLSQMLLNIEKWLFSNAGTSSAYGPTSRRRRPASSAPSHKSHRPASRRVTAVSPLRAPGSTSPTRSSPS
jgi:hypothetical protein